MRPLIYMDEDVSTVYAMILEKQCYSVSTTEQCGKKGQSDAVQLAYSIENGAVLVTHNIKHFGELHKLVFASGGHHAGIIGINQTGRDKRHRGINEIATKLVQYLENKNPVQLKDTFHVI